MSRSYASLYLLLLALGTSAFPANDPTQWTSKDVYRILNNSPWTKLVKMNFSSSNAGGLGNQSSADNPDNRQTPMRTGGIGRRGMGAGRSSGTYGSGAGGAPPSSQKSGATEVKVQWQSARIVQTAEAKKTGTAVDGGALKPMDEYVIAVIGLPVTALGGRAASNESDATLNSATEEHIEQRVRSGASIIRSGHDPLTPTKVELDQGSDGRMLIHFSKSDPIDAIEKTVEFRLITGHAELRKKFVLKEMEYQGKLDL